jgi:hypothetical protein
MYRILHIPSSSFLTYHKEPIGKTGKTLRRITIGDYGRRSTVYEFRFRWSAKRYLKRVFTGSFFGECQFHVTKYFI